MKTDKAIKFLEDQIRNPKHGLPLDIFYFISRLTPMINVDLLIKDKESRCLLAWRDDKYAGTGWHIPGGIVRFKETLEERILKVAEDEVGATVSFNPNPIAINQIIAPHDTRGHFISLLYRCYLEKKFIPKNKGLTKKDRGFLAWHSGCPDNLIKFHDIYRKFI